MLLEQEHGLRGGVDRKRVGPLHRAAALAWHAVAAPGVGEPQVLERKHERPIKTRHSIFIFYTLYSCEDRRAMPLVILMIHRKMICQPSEFYIDKSVRDFYKA